MKYELGGLKPPFFVHCALSKVKLDEKFGKIDSRQEFIEAHLQTIEKKLGKDNLIFPTFNYDFGKIKLFRPETDSSALGALPNHIVTKADYHRSHTPFYSCASPNYEFIQPYLNCSYYEPFFENSIFGDLYRLNGTIVLYGTEVLSATYFHYVLHVAGPPLYRYDKSFMGQVVFQEQQNNVKVVFHVRPLGFQIKHNWEKIEKILTQADAVKCLAPNVRALKARSYVDIIGPYVNRRDFPLLDRDVRVNVINKLNDFGRRFEISDFEN